MTKLSFETCCRTDSSLKYHLLYTGNDTKSNILLKIKPEKGHNPYNIISTDVSKMHSNEVILYFL